MRPLSHPAARSHSRNAACWTSIRAICSKTVVSRLPSLTYLDDRPVFDKERELTAAWAAGGLEAEQAAREAVREREAAAHRRNTEFMQNIRAEAFRQVRAASPRDRSSHAPSLAPGGGDGVTPLQRREALGMPPGDTDPALEDFSDTEWQPEEDPPELVDARKKLERYLATQSDGAGAARQRSVLQRRGACATLRCVQRLATRSRRCTMDRCTRRIVRRGRRAQVSSQPAWLASASLT